MFDALGAPQPFLPVAVIGLSRNTSWAAYAAGEAPSLILADWCASSRLVAVDASTRAVRWATDAGALGLCLGVAVSTVKGVVIANDWDASSLHIHRLSDGVRLHSIAAPRIGSYMATDPVTGAMFCGGFGGGICSVLSWGWTGDGLGLWCNGPVAAAGTEVVSRPLTVVPPAPEKLPHTSSSGCGMRISCV